MNNVDYLIQSGDYTARITAHGAALRQLQYGRRDLVVPFDLGVPIPDFRGIIAAPWPNRIADGSYRWDGVVRYLGLNEPSRGSALHGLVFDVPWNVESSSAESITLSCTVEASKGYPSALDIKVNYSLDEGGLHYTVTATNTGKLAVPYGVCPHPYLVAGDAPLDECVLSFAATSFLEVTPDRLLPLDLKSLDGHEFDFRVAHAIGGTKIDHAFTGFDAQAEPELRLSDPAGTYVGMSWDERSPWLQIHTADKADGSANRLGLAVEPMTCPPDAFNSGTDLLILEPGGSHTVEWRIFGH